MSERLAFIARDPDPDLVAQFKRVHWMVGFEDSKRGVAIVFGDDDGNARRFVATWNACAAIDTETLERVEFPAMRINDASLFHAATRVRHDLLAALAEAKDYIAAVARKEPGTDRANIYDASAKRLARVMAEAGWRE